MKAIQILHEMNDTVLGLAEEYVQKAAFAKFTNNEKDFEMYTRWSQDQIDSSKRYLEAIQELESLKQTA